jgi:glycogen debranching enzyme
MALTRTPASPGSARRSVVMGSSRRWSALDQSGDRPWRVRYLAEVQAREVILAQDAEPGKILHEARLGELAALGEIPFRHYYGTVDSTPLFVILAAAYYERTGDLALIESIWPNIELALRWIDRYGDVDGDGFVEYA